MKTPANPAICNAVDLHCSDSASDLNFSSQTEASRREAFLDLPLRKSVSCGFAWEPAGVSWPNEGSCSPFEQLLPCDDRCASLPIGPAVASPFANIGPNFLAPVISLNASRTSSTPAPVQTSQQQQQQHAQYQDAQRQQQQQSSRLHVSGPTTPTGSQTAAADWDRRRSSDGLSARPPRPHRPCQQQQQQQQRSPPGPQVKREETHDSLLYAAQHPIVVPPRQHPHGPFAAAAASGDFGGATATILDGAQGYCGGARGIGGRARGDFGGASPDHGVQQPQGSADLDCPIRRTSSAPVPWQTQLQSLLQQHSLAGGAGGVGEEDEDIEYYGAAHEPHPYHHHHPCKELMVTGTGSSAQSLSASQLDRLHRASTSTPVPLQQQLWLRDQLQQQRSGGGSEPLLLPPRHQHQQQQQQQQHRPCITTGVTTMLSAANLSCPGVPPTVAFTVPPVLAPACLQALAAAASAAAQSQRIVFTASATPRILLNNTSSRPPPAGGPFATPAAASDRPFSARRGASRSAAWGGHHKRLSGDGGCVDGGCGDGGCGGGGGGLGWAAAAQHKRLRNSEEAPVRYISHKERDRDSRMRVNQIMEQLEKVVPPSTPTCPRRRAKHSVLADTLQLIKRAYETLPKLSTRSCGGSDPGDSTAARAMATGGSLADVRQLLEGSWSDHSDACLV